MIAIIEKMLAPLQRRVKLMVCRAVVNLVNDGLKMQTVQVSLLANSDRDDVEHFQTYGLTSNPHPGAEGIMVSIGGNQDHGIVIAVDDRRYRLIGLAEGEVALYDDLGQKVHLTRNGILVHGAGNPLTVENVSNINMTGSGVANITVNGKATITASEVDLVGTGGTAKGMVQADCICPFTNAPHMMVSAKVKGSM